MNCLKNITDADVIAAIRNARERVVFLAPGISDDAATALADTWKRLGPEAVSVILDVDPEVMRLGYGSLKGVETIRDTATALGQAVGHQPGVRICVVIADGSSLIFTPTPLLIEAGSTQPERPNGIALAATPPVLRDELGAGEEGNSTRQIGLEAVAPKQVEAMRKDLAENPPLKFDVARTERVFNSKLEFVEFELEGCMVSRHTVTIPPELVGMAKMDAKTRNKLRSSFRLLEDTDVLDAKKKISERSLRDERARIGRKYLRPIKGFGMVILRANKDGFESEVEGLRAKVVAFKNALAEKLKSLFEENAKRLTAALLPSVVKNPPEDWTGLLGPKPDKAQIAERLRLTLLEAFGSTESLLGAMRVNLVFKGITYATLHDPKFRTCAEQEFPQLTIHDEYDASRGVTPAVRPTQDLQKTLFDE